VRRGKGRTTSNDYGCDSGKPDVPHHPSRGTTEKPCIARCGVARLALSHCVAWSSSRHGDELHAGNRSIGLPDAHPASPTQVEQISRLPVRRVGHRVRWWTDGPRVRDIAFSDSPVRFNVVWGNCPAVVCGGFRLALDPPDHRQAVCRAGEEKNGGENHPPDRVPPRAGRRLGNRVCRAEGG